MNYAACIDQNIGYFIALKEIDNHIHIYQMKYFARTETQLPSLSLSDLYRMMYVLVGQTVYVLTIGLF